MVDYRAVAAQQAARGAAGGRPPGSERHLLAAANRLAVGRHPGALRACDDLLQSLRAVAEARRVGPSFRSRLGCLRRRSANDRLVLNPRSSARRQRQKGGPQATPAAARDHARAACMGRSRGGLTTKIHALVDANGLPVILKLSEGQAHDGRSAADMLDGIGSGQTLIADRAYDSDALRRTLSARGAWANIKPMPRRINVPSVSPFLLRYRNLVERLFDKLKHFRP